MTTSDRSAPADQAAPSELAEARFAGWVSVFGFCCLVGQWAMVALLVLLLGVAGATGSMPFAIGAAEVLTWLGTVGAVLWFGHLVLQNLRRCRFVVVDRDGTWILRNAFGREIGRIDRDTPRQVQGMSQKVRSSGTHWRRTYAVITTDGSTWQTCRSIPKETDRAVAQLRSPPFA